VLAYRRLLMDWWGKGHSKVIIARFDIGVVLPFQRERGESSELEKSCLIMVSLASIREWGRCIMARKTLHLIRYSLIFLRHIIRVGIVCLFVPFSQGSQGDSAALFHSPVPPLLCIPGEAKLFTTPKNRPEIDSGAAPVITRRLS
jgi:hypothetical protein